MKHGQALAKQGVTKPHFPEKCTRNAIISRQIGILSPELKENKLKTIVDCARFDYRSGQ